MSPYPVKGIVVEKEHERSHAKYDKKTNTWKRTKECHELDIYEHDAGDAVELCVSERVFNDAMLGHEITLTEEYH